MEKLTNYNSFIGLFRAYFHTLSCTSEPTLKDLKNEYEHYFKDPFSNYVKLKENVLKEIENLIIDKVEIKDKLEYEIHEIYGFYQESHELFGISEKLLKHNKSYQVWSLFSDFYNSLVGKKLIAPYQNKFYVSNFWPKISKLLYFKIRQATVISKLAENYTNKDFDKLIELNRNFDKIAFQHTINQVRSKDQLKDLLRATFENWENDKIEWLQYTRKKLSPPSRSNIIEAAGYSVFWNDWFNETEQAHQPKTEFEQPTEYRPNKAISNSVKYWLSFLIHVHPRKHKIPLDESDYNNLVQWTIYYFENKKPPTIKTPIRFYSCQKSELFVAMKKIYKEILPNSTFAANYFEFIVSCFADLKGYKPENIIKSREPQYFTDLYNGIERETQ